MDERLIEELLEGVWLADEAGKNTLEAVREAVHPEESRLEEAQLQAALVQARGRGLLRLEGDRVILTKEGWEVARGVVRRHRLAERLLRDVLDLRGAVMESHACRFEHLLSPDAASSICILLGHPTVCPHGNPIPSGDCCKKGVGDVRPLVLPASRLNLSEEATVAYIGTRQRLRLERLAALGILPGVKIRLEQKRPSYLVRVDETLLGLDDAIVKEIYVRRASSRCDRAPGRHRWRHAGQADG